MSIILERKERIASYIASKEYIALNMEELMTVLEVPAEAESDLKDIMDELCVEGRIYLTKKNRYMPCESEKDTVKGKLSCNAKGYFGFVISEDGNDVFVKGEDMADALNGDIVAVKIVGDNNGSRREGKVIRVLERANSTVVGVIKDCDDRYLVMIPDNRRIYKKIYIPNDKLMEAEKDDRVAVEIDGYDDNGRVYGSVLAVLGAQESLKSCIEGIIIDHEIKQTFDPETLEAAEKISDTVSDINGRLDLRDKLIFTIDGDYARDFDDAISLDMLDNGNYYLGVHIADVTEYVTEGNPLDDEAFLRATSVYLADRVIPMLPEKLSNGICSLNPNVDRLTLSVFMEINKRGEVLAHNIEKSVIKSKERMTYNNVTSLLEGNADEELFNRYEYMIPTLKQMLELSDVLENMRSGRGAIDFDFPETSVIVDDAGEPIDIVGDERGISNKMIEEFMLTANETVAEYAFWSELPFVYRTHEPPSEDKINSFHSFIQHFGISLKGKIDKDNPIHPKTLQAILETVKGTPEERMVASTMLHSLMKAEYKPQNLGHFGLSAKYYCHFTSPIRRYPDLIIHRILKEFISGDMNANSLSHFEKVVTEASKRSSEAEVNAEHTERDVDDLMKTAYMSSFIGEEFKGVIANVTGFGMFVELENSVEGLVRMENMNEDYFVYDENSSTLTGERTGVVYKIGDEVEVVLMRTDIMLRQIDFVLSRDANGSMYRKFKKTAESRPADLSKNNGKRSNNQRKFVKQRRKGRRNGR